MSPVSIYLNGYEIEICHIHYINQELIAGKECLSVVINWPGLHRSVVDKNFLIWKLACVQPAQFKMVATYVVAINLTALYTWQLS